jgi:hypothetical protein
MLDWLPDLIAVLKNCCATIGDHSDEEHLRKMAQECRSLADKIQAVGDQDITAAQKALADSQWTGDARTTFDQWWATNINPPAKSDRISDAEVIKRCRDAATALDEIADAAGQTKKAFNKLIASVIFWMVAGAVMSAFLTWAGMAMAWAVRLRALAAAANISRWYAMVLRTAATLLRLLKPFTLFGSKAAGGSLSTRSVFLRALQANKAIGRWSLGGNVAATVLANGVFQLGSAVVDGVQGKPHKWTDPTALSVSQIGDLLLIGRFGGLTGPAGQTLALTKLAANNSRLLNLGFGAVAGVAPLTVIDTVFDPKPLWDSSNPLNSIVVRWGMSAAVAGGFNAWVGAKFPGPGGLKELAAKNAQDWQLIDKKFLDETPYMTPDGRPVVMKWQASDRNPFDQQLVPVALEKSAVNLKGGGVHEAQPADVLVQVDSSALASERRLLNTTHVDASMPYESLHPSQSQTYKVPVLSAMPLVKKFFSFHFHEPVDPYRAPLYIPKSSSPPPPWFIQRMDQGKTIFTPLTALPIKATLFNRLPGTMAQSSLLSYEPSIGLAGMRAFATTGPTPHMDANRWDVPVHAGDPQAAEPPKPPAVPDPPPPAPATVGGDPVTVQPWGHGPYDSLSHIAREVYGDADLWTIIYDANRDAIGGHPDLIRDGMVLKIPKIPKSEVHHH